MKLDRRVYIEVIAVSGGCFHFNSGDMGLTVPELEQFQADPQGRICDVFHYTTASYSWHDLKLKLTANKEQSADGCDASAQQIGSGDGGSYDARFLVGDVLCTVDMCFKAELRHGLKAWDGKTYQFVGELSYETIEKHMQPLETTKRDTVLDALKCLTMVPSEVLAAEVKASSACHEHSMRFYGPDRNGAIYGLECHPDEAGFLSRKQAKVEAFKGQLGHTASAVQHNMMVLEKEVKSLKQSNTELKTRNGLLEVQNREMVQKPCKYLQAIDLAGASDAELQELSGALGEAAQRLANEQAKRVSCCKICCLRKTQMMLWPCRHMCVCAICAEDLVRCPIPECNALVEEKYLDTQ